MFFTAQMWPKRKRSRSKLSRYIPPDIIFEILSHLPPKDLVRFMRVCKAWESTIRSQEFIKAHHDRSMKTNSPRTLLVHRPGKYISFSVNFDSEGVYNAVPALWIKQPRERHASILGCCNGLVCIKYRNSLSEAESFLVWNPSILRFKRIPFTAVELPADTVKIPPRYGFGYDSANDDYKLVRVVLLNDEHKVGSEVKIYSLKSDSWKKIQSLPCIKDLRMYSTHLSFLNGALYWLMRHRLNGRVRGVSLDLTTEKYDEFPAPPVEYKYPYIWRLEVLDGSLCICPRPYSPKRYIDRSDVWIMKEDGVTTSWIRLYTIEMDHMPDRMYRYCKPLLFSKTREMVLLHLGGTLFWYDIEKMRFEKVDIPGTSGCWTPICVGNLRLLDGDPVT